MQVKKLYKLFKNYSKSILIILFLTDITAGKFDLMEKFVRSTISLIMDQM